MRLPAPAIHVRLSCSSPEDSAIPHASDRFAGQAEDYARFRPDYPASVLDRLAEDIGRVEADGPVLDVGSGTGIFTRQLARRLGPGIPVAGIEPSPDMRREAARADDEAPAPLWLEGTAERLPVAVGSARAVVAATAAHWFDRPAFYREAARVLAPGGILAIVEYVRDVEQSPAAAAVERFLREEGGPKAYARPDYLAELRGLYAFAAPRGHCETVTLPLSADGFVGLALSSSHARAVVRRLGAGPTEAALRDIAATLTGADGTIAFGYRFQLFTARRS